MRLFQMYCFIFFVKSKRKTLWYQRN